MSKEPHELSEADKSTIRILKTRLDDHTLSPKQHRDTQEKIDQILWQGPYGRMAHLVARIEQLEDAVFSGKAPAVEPETTKPAAVKPQVKPVADKPKRGRPRKSAKAEFPDEGPAVELDKLNRPVAKDVDDALGFGDGVSEGGAGG